MSTAKTGLAVPFNPPDNPTRTHRPRKRNSNNSSSNNNNSNSNQNNGSNSNSQQPNRRIERSSSSNNLSNGLNNNSSNNQKSGSNTSSTSGADNNVNNQGGKGNRQRRNGSNVATTASTTTSVLAPTNGPTGAQAEGAVKGPSTMASGSERSRRGYLSNRTSANTASRLDQDPVSRTRPGTTASSSQGRLFDPKKDPVVPRTVNNNNNNNNNNSSSSSNSNNKGVLPQSMGDAKNIGANNPHQRQRSGASQTQRLYDPNQPQSSSPAAASTAVSSSSSSTASPAAISSASSSTADPLVRLTKEIQQLEKKVMEKPSRRTLDDDDDVLDTANHRLGGHMGWNARIDTSKRLAYKYLKLLQLDFKSSLKHDIDTRCWRLAIYPLIEAFRAALRNPDLSGESEGSHHSQSDHDEDLQESVRHHFATFIGFAQEFYETLKTVLQTLEVKYGTPPGTGGGGTLQPPRWHRCIGILGDLARYRWLHRLNDSEEGAKPGVDWLVAARRLYREAIDLGPGNGKMYNQLALLSGGRGMESLYYYSKSLTVKSSFMNARETLMAFFSANEQIKALHALSLKSASVRKAALLNTNIQDCEGSYLFLQAMLFGKINLDVFEKRFKTFEKQLRHVHQRRLSNNNNSNTTISTTTASNANSSGPQDMDDKSLKDRNSMSWERFYFMMAVTNLAALYEFNWTTSVIAKSATAFGPMKDHLATVTTLPYSSKLLFSTMEQAMERYLSSMGENQKVFCSTLEEQRGWLVYCLVILIWMSSRPFGTKEEGMMDNWLMLANHETLPTFWSTLVRFMNYHWSQMTPFEQSDLLSNLSEELSAVETGATGYSKGPQEGTLFCLSAPPLGPEWELRGLAWVPYSRYGRLFKDARPALDDNELKTGELWKRGSVKTEDLSNRFVELSFISALRMEIIEFDFCENAFKVNEIHLARVEKLIPAKSEPGSSSSHLTVNDGFSSDDAALSPSHASSSYEDTVEDGESLDEDDLYWDGMHDMDPNDPAAEILELKSKRDRLRSLLGESGSSPRRDGRARGSQRGQGGGSVSGKIQAPKSGNRATGSRGYMERRQQHHRSNVDLHQQRAAMVTENSTLVVDTNCLISDWTIVQRLVNADRWTVIIPLAVITELDGLKNNPAPLGPAATAAITYLEGCMALPKAKRPKRLKIQTSRGNYMNDLSFRVESFGYDQQQQQQQQSSYQSNHYRKTTASGEGEGGGTGSEREEGEDDDDEMIMRNRNVDDFILSLCLWHQENGQSSWSQARQQQQQQSSSTLQQQQGVFLVTDDRNLRVKARARMVEVLGKDDVTVLTAGRFV